MEKKEAPDTHLRREVGAGAGAVELTISSLAETEAVDVHRDDRLGAVPRVDAVARDVRLVDEAGITTLDASEADHGRDRPRALTGPVRILHELAIGGDGTGDALAVPALVAVQRLAELVGRRGPGLGVAPAANPLAGVGGADDERPATAAAGRARAAGAGAGHALAVAGVTRARSVALLAHGLVHAARAGAAGGRAEGTGRAGLGHHVVHAVAGVVRGTRGVAGLARRLVGRARAPAAGHVLIGDAHGGGAVADALAGRPLTPVVRARLACHLIGAAGDLGARRAHPLIGGRADLVDRAQRALAGVVAPAVGPTHLPRGVTRLAGGAGVRGDRVGDAIAPTRRLIDAAAVRPRPVHTGHRGVLVAGAGATGHELDRASDTHGAGRRRLVDAAAVGPLARHAGLDRVLVGAAGATRHLANLADHADRRRSAIDGHGGDTVAAAATEPGTICVADDAAGLTRGARARAHG